MVAEGDNTPANHVKKVSLAGENPHKLSLKSHFGGDSVPANNVQISVLVGIILPHEQDKRSRLEKRRIIGIRGKSQRKKSRYSKAKELSAEFAEGYVTNHVEKTTKHDKNHKNRNFVFIIKIE